MELSGERGHALPLGRRAVSGRALDLERDRGQGLAGLIVQGARDPQALALLCHERGAASRSPLLGEPIEHRIEGAGEGDELRTLSGAPAEAQVRVAEVDLIHLCLELAQRGEGAADEHQVDREHCRQPDSEDQRLGEPNRGVHGYRGEQQQDEGERRAPPRWPDVARQSSERLRAESRTGVGRAIAAANQSRRADAWVRGEW